MIYTLLMTRPESLIKWSGLRGLMERSGLRGLPERTAWAPRTERTAWAHGTEQALERTLGAHGTEQALERTLGAHGTEQALGAHGTERALERTLGAHESERALERTLGGSRNGAGSEADYGGSIGVRKDVSGPTHCRNHTLDLILSYGIEANCVDILQQSDDISDHYLVLCKHHIAKAVNSTPFYKYRGTITSTKKDCFVSNLPDLSQFLSIYNSAENLDDVTETMDFLISSTLDTVAPLRLRKIRDCSH